MKIDSINPIPDPFYSSGPSSGHRLLQVIDELFHSYHHWLSDYPENFKSLSLIQRVIHISIQGGSYLDPTDEKALIEDLEELKEGLFNLGTVGHRQIPEKINRMLSRLFAKNPKARLVEQLTKLEDYMALSSLNPKLKEEIEETKRVVEHILRRVLTVLPEVNAHFLSRELTSVVNKLSSKTSDSPEKMLRLFRENVKPWL